MIKIPVPLQLYEGNDSPYRNASSNCQQYGASVCGRETHCSSLAISLPSFVSFVVNNKDNQPFPAMQCEGQCALSESFFITVCVQQHNASFSIYPQTFCVFLFLHPTTYSLYIRQRSKQTLLSTRLNVNQNAIFTRPLSRYIQPEAIYWIPEGDVFSRMCLWSGGEPDQASR